MERGRLTIGVGWRRNRSSGGRNQGVSKRRPVVPVGELNGMDLGDVPFSL